VISSPVSLSVPRTLGRDKSFKASSIVMVSKLIVERSDAVFGVGASFFFLGFFPSSLITSGKTSVMYGPKRPDFAIT
jgi:hypothetical protein